MVRSAAGWGGIWAVGFGTRAVRLEHAARSVVATPPQLRRLPIAIRGVITHLLNFFWHQIGSYNYLLISLKKSKLK